MSTHEHDRAMLEGQEVAASDLYFAARHEMLDTKDRRNVFKAGFERGWRVKEALAQPVAAEPEQDPDPFDDRKDAERYRWLRTPPNNLNPAIYGPTGGLLRRDTYLDSAIDVARNPNSSIEE